MLFVEKYILCKELTTVHTVFNLHRLHLSRLVSVAINLTYCIFSTCSSAVIHRELSSFVLLIITCLNVSIRDRELCYCSFSVIIRHTANLTGGWGL